MPSLTDSRRQLETALAEALLHSGAGALDVEEAKQAAESVIGGLGLPEAIASRYGKRPVCALVSFDADRIHSWVFASERVQVVGGASRTLEALNQHGHRLRRTGKLPNLHGAAFSAGGGGLLFASIHDESDLDRLEDWVRRRLEAPGRDLKFTVVAMPLYVDDLRADVEMQPLTAPLDRFARVSGLRGALTRLQVRVREAKEERARPLTRACLAAGSGLLLERCPSCGRYPPSKTPVTDDPACWCKSCRSLRGFYRRTAGDRYVKDGGTPITFADFAEAVDRPRKYLGFIAIDGNGMGSLVQRIGSFLELRAFSEVVSQIYADARASVEEQLEDLIEKGDPRSAYLSLLSGGDEITLVLPAAAAPEVTISLLDAIREGFDAATRPGGLLHEAFQTNSEVLDGLRKAGAGAGLILAPPTYPVRLLRRYADELLKAAKSLCAKSNLRFAVAWRFLTDSSPLPTGMTAGEPGYVVSADDFDSLVSEVKTAGTTGLPRSALQRLLANHRDEELSLRLLERGAEEVLAHLDANFFRYQLARNPKLAAWWQAICPETAVDHDPVRAWLAAGNGRKLEQIVDLLSLEKPARGEEAT